MQPLSLEVFSFEQTAQASTCQTFQRSGVTQVRCHAKKWRTKSSMAFSLEQERLHEHGGFYDKICGFNREWFPGAGAISHRDSYGAHVGDRLLLQQEFRGLQLPGGVKPLLHNVVAKRIGQSEQAHSLMVHHPRPDDLTTRAVEAAARVGVVGCLIESVRAEPSEGIHSMQIAERGLAIHIQS